MALGLPATASMTPPVEVSSWSSLQASLVPVMDSKPSRVPLPASRPMQEMVPASPPTSLQSVISPVKILPICSTVRFSTLLSVLTMTAMPSSATMVSVRPPAFSSSFRAREARPMSALPLLAASMPAPEPVGS